MKNLVLIGVLGTAGACGFEAVEDAPEGEAPEFRDLADPDIVRSTREYIAKKDSSGCPAYLGPVGNRWFGKSVFDEHPDLAGFTPPGNLAHYCRFTSNAPNPDPAPLIAFGFAKLNPVTVGTMPQTIVREELAPMLEARYRWRYKDPAATGTDFTGTNDDRAPVTLAIVDTEPNGKAGRAKHGRIMMQLAETIACPEGAAGCKVAIEPELGLPRLPDGTSDWTNGGFHGGLVDAALGIISAVQRWEDAADGSRLVISLALGIDTGVFEPGSIDAEMNLIDDALRYAACKGATNLAAAGNDLRLGTTGALYPARLEQTAVPHPNQCWTEFELQNTYQDTETYRPLVHAIGGLNDGSGQAPVTREDSLPRLLAPATHAVTADWEHVITGTSAAVTTAAASTALLLSFDDNLGRSTVMQRLYDYGGGTGLLADLWFGTVQPAARRIRLCNALEEICDGNDRCGEMEFDCTITQIPYGDAHLRAALAGIQNRKTLPLTLANKAVPCTNNGGVKTKKVYFEATNPGTCQDIDYQPMDAITEPQPDGIGCDTCGFTSGTNELAIQLVETFDTPVWLVDSVEVTLWDEQQEPWDYHLGDPVLSSTQITDVPLPEDERVPDIVERGTVTIHFFNTTHSTYRVTTDTLVIL